MYFHGGIDAFCERYDVEIVEIREAGDVWCLRRGKAKWEEFPFENVEPKVVGIKRH